MPVSLSVLTVALPFSWHMRVSDAGIKFRSGRKVNNLSGIWFNFKSTNYGSVFPWCEISSFSCTVSIFSDLIASSFWEIVAQFRHVPAVIIYSRQGGWQDLMKEIKKNIGKENRKIHLFHYFYRISERRCLNLYRLTSRPISDFDKWRRRPWVTSDFIRGSRTEMTCFWWID